MELTNLRFEEMRVRAGRCWDPDPSKWIVKIRCGLHSGFPKCCIRFYVREWHEILKPYFVGAGAQSVLLGYKLHADPAWKMYQKLKKAYMCRLGLSEPAGYVQCIDCLLSAQPPAVVKQCPR